MKVSDLHWTWYMYASIPARVVNRRTTKPKAKNSRKVEEILETYDKNGRRNKRENYTFVEIA